MNPRMADGRAAAGQSAPAPSILQQYVGTAERATVRTARIFMPANSTVEGMHVAGLMRQKGLPGIRKRRRDLANTAMGEARGQLMYKVSWYGENW